jgi:HlyD family secretion protein
VAPGKSNRLKFIIPVAAIAILGGAWFYWHRVLSKPKPLVLSGSLEARTVLVGSLFGGRVHQVFVDEGAHVTAGQPLASLETDSVDRLIYEQQAAIAAAQAQLAKALAGNRPEEIAQARAVAQHDERERVRYARLLREGIVSRELYEGKATQAKTSSEQLRLLEKGSRKEDIAAARAQVEQQQARLASLQKQRAETNIVSSVNGVVQSLKIRPGDLAAPNQGIAELLESDQLWVRVYVPETLLGAVRMNAPVNVYVDTFPTRPFRGRVAQVSSQGEYTPRNVQTREQRAEQVFGVKVVVDPDPALKAGMAATVDLGVKGSAQ